ncbi:acyl carrier protein [Jatrophihabitans sp.]|uniref:acyl carrier protein n=1 Tax=Jatrophihabitans sp. TaxID=1932789 RepID=UPI002CA2BEDC|nr:hypothetical protein [Jatrophihabitans sp.]
MSPDELRELLLSNSAVGLAPDIGLSDCFVLDSLALTWVLYQVQESYGLEPDPDDERISGLTSIERMAGYLDQLRPGGVRT